MNVTLTVNGTSRTVEVEPRTTLLDCLRDNLGLTGAHAGCEHGVCGACTVLLDGMAARSCLMFAVQADGIAITTIEGLSPGPGELSLLQDAFCETHGTAVRLLHAGDDPCRPCAARRQSGSRHGRISWRRSPATSAAAPAMRRSSRRSRSPPSACAAPTSRLVRSHERRPFPLPLLPTAVCARTAASWSARGSSSPTWRSPGVRHVALVTCPYPAARIVAIDKAPALAMPGVAYVLDGRSSPPRPCRSPPGSTRRNVPRRPLAVDIARYAGEWVVAVVADTRARAEDAAEQVRITYQRLPFVLDAEEALEPESPPVHADHGSNVLLDRTFVWGEVERDFAASPHHLALRVKWGRSSTVPIETFGVLASWDPWREILDIWASIQMPKFPDQVAAALKLPGSAVRVHYDVDVGGSYGVKRGIKHTVLVGYLSRRLGVPVRLIEDRLENMRGGDAHGPERLFDVEVAFDETGVIRAMKMRALDNVGAYAGRSPFQLGKPVGAIVGPYRIGSVQYRAIAVTTNKTVQEAVRAFGQSPTNYAIERTIDEVAIPARPRPAGGRRRNLIRKEEFPYTIPSGSTYDSGDYHTVIDKVLARADYDELIAERDRLRASGRLAGIGIAACLEPSGGNSAFEPLLNPKNATTTWMDSCRISVDLSGAVTATMHTTSSGQGHETLVATVVGESARARAGSASA